MKKIMLLLFVPMSFLVLSGCKKSYTEEFPLSKSVVEDAKLYFNREVLPLKPTEIDFDKGPGSNTNPRKEQLRSPVWTMAYTARLSRGNAVIVPVHYKSPFLIKTNLDSKHFYSIDDITKLVIYKDAAGKYQSEVVTFVPDSIYKGSAHHKFTGISLVEDWLGNTIRKFKYLENGKVLRYAESSSQDRIEAQNRTNTLENERYGFQVCYEMDGYNYSMEDPEHGYSWVETIGCGTYFFNDEDASSGLGDGGDYSGLSGGGGGSGDNYGIPVAYTVTVLPGKNIIANFKDYSKCFDNNASNNYSYQITISVSQPVPGTRTTWSFNPVTGGSSSANDIVGVGHTFLTLTEKSPVKTTVRNVGFYPSVNVDPLTPVSPGAFNNDEVHESNISLTIDVTSSQFTAVLNYISEVASSKYKYDLNNFNCTTFGMSALSQIGINLPRTTGTWPGGAGMNPGDLGEDIRSMNLSSNMTRSDGTNSHLNQGTCN